MVVYRRTVQYLIPCPLALQSSTLSTSPSRGRLNYTKNFFFSISALYQGFSVILSLVSLSWSMVSFEQSNRWANPEKPQMTLVAYICQFLWRLFMVASRVLTMALFATVYQEELFIFILLHWVLMTVWIFNMASIFHNSLFVPFYRFS